MKPSRTATAPPAGYSGTPLARKLGIKAGSLVLARGAPDNYVELLSPLPDAVRFSQRIAPTVDIVHLFTTRRSTLNRELTGLRPRLRPDAMIWVSWPKKASRVDTDITEDVIRELCLPLGFVDVKVCAVDSTWSGLKLVIRKSLR
ncbi:MAG: DUF3052 domain-containing protein [Xanthomonadales bacterium]|nr:DUF3052 domain-containing protein [Xanthomonadales bacterium]